MPHFPKPFFKKNRGVWYVEIDRRQHNLGPDRDEAFRQYYQLMGQPRQQRVSPESLVGIVDAFLEWVQKNRSPDTYEWYRYRLQRFVDKHPNLRASSLRPYHVQEWVDSYDFSVNSRRNYLRAVKRCMTWANKQGYLNQNPIANLELPPAQRRETVLSQEEFDRLMSYVRNDAFADLLTTTWETGCRPQESLRVEARHVDLANHRWVFPRSEAKMKRNCRVVYLSERAMEITRRLVLAHPEGPLFRNASGSPWTTDSVNCSFAAIQIRMGKDEMKKRGECVDEKAAKKLIGKLSSTRICRGKTVTKTKSELRCEAKRKLTFRRAAQLAPRYSLYALRHSWATNALQRGVDALTVAILMGHEDPSTLARVYQHLSLNPKHLLEQARKAVG